MGYGVAMNITLDNIDLTNTEHLAHAREIYATLSSALLATVQDIRIDFRTLDLIPMHAESPVVDTLTLVIYGGTTRTFLETMLGLIQRDGKTTLVVVASEMNISRDTARAYLRNAGRTAAARKVLLPVLPTWNHESGCNEYRAMKSADQSASR